MNIFITGGASGLGKAITETLAAAFPDAKIYFTFNSSAEAAVALEKKYSNSKGIQFDFTNEKSLDDISEKITALNIDVLVNNALPSYVQNHFHKTDSREFLESFEKNIYPVLQITKVFIKTARQRKSGKIITVLSSLIGGMPGLGMAEYTANKQYLLSMAKSWATENARFNIQSNCVSPDFMETPLNKDFDARLKESMIKSHPLKRLLTPEDVAVLVKFLVTAPAHLNGQNIFMDTGKN